MFQEKNSFFVYKYYYSAVFVLKYYLTSRLLATQPVHNLVKIFLMEYLFYLFISLKAFNRLFISSESWQLLRKFVILQDNLLYQIWVKPTVGGTIAQPLLMCLLVWIWTFLKKLASLRYTNWIKGSRCYTYWVQGWKIAVDF